MKKILLINLIFIFIYSCVGPSTQGFNLSNSEVARETKIQKEMAISQSLKYQKRINKVALPLLKENRDLCGYNITYQLGMTYSSIYDYSNEWREAAKSILNLDNNCTNCISGGMTITSITEGSAAEKVGLQPGDIIVSINDVLVGTTEKEIKSFRKRYKDIKYKLTDATVKIKRDGLSRNFRFKPDRVCDYPASYYNSDNVNAYADGSKIMISRGMMRFIEDDNELALILSHELAHNAMNHMDAKNANAVPGIMLDMLSAYVGVQTYGMYGDATRNMFSQAFETEADYIALYFLYRAQFDIDNSANFWRRMSAENPGSIKQNHNSTHPSSPERYLRIEKTIEEIYAKEKNGEAVKPNAVIPNTGPRKGAWDKKGSNWD